MVHYDPHLWRSTFFAIRGSMIRVITKRTLYVTGVAAALTAVHVFLVPLSIPAAANVHGLIGTALGLLLVFRTNASYDRWWEGRKLWGSIVNTCRNLARLAAVHLDQNPERQARVVRLAMAFPRASMHLLRGMPWAPDALHPDDARAVSERAHAPVGICTAVSAHLRDARDQGQLSDLVLTMIDANAHALVDHIGACERIHRTPLPFAYVVHLRRALTIYVSTLPLALLGTFGWSTLIIVFLVGYTLFGIEEIGVEIEDPFEGDDNDLPLEQISDGLDRNLKAFLPHDAKR